MASVRVQTGRLSMLLEQLPTDRFDLALTVPPIGHRWRSRDWPYLVPPPGVWRSLLRPVRPGGRLVCLGASDTLHRLMTAVEDAGWVIEDQLAWLRRSEQTNDAGLERAWEGICVARNPGMFEPGWAPPGAPQAPGLDCPGNVWLVSGRRPEDIPESNVLEQGRTRAGVLEWLVRLFCPPTGDILDPFCGSGETAAAAVAQGRGWHGLEVDLGKSRMAVEMARSAVRASPFEPRV